MTTPTDEMLLAEYRQLKGEQANRIAYRDQLLYATAAAIAATLTIARTGHGLGYLLLIPVIAVVLGWTYLCNDSLISSIGRYVRETLPQMGWERDHPADTHRRARKVIQLGVNLTAFTGSAYAALTAFWLSSPSPAVLLLAVSAAEAVAVAVLAWQFTLGAEIGGTPS